MLISNNNISQRVEDLKKCVASRLEIKKTTKDKRTQHPVQGFNRHGELWTRGGALPCEILYLSVTTTKRL